MTSHVACNIIRHLDWSWPVCLCHSLHVLSVFSAPPDSLCNLDIPIINVELDGIFDLPHISPFRNSVALLESTGNRAESEEESESTVLWRHWVIPPHTHPTQIPSAGWLNETLHRQTRPLLQPPTNALIQWPFTSSNWNTSGSHRHTSPSLIQGGGGGPRVKKNELF